MIACSLVNHHHNRSRLKGIAILWEGLLRRDLALECVRAALPKKSWLPKKSTVIAVAYPFAFP